ncbi:MAG: BatA domain-containing protein, partial [Ignavibacteriae bacterium]|nr:BatA domain-containing protein [Ignavibacteriota bacterium]
MWTSNLTFANPEFLYGLTVIPLIVFWYARRHRAATSDIRFSSLLPFNQLKPSLKERVRHIPFILRMVVIAMLLVGFARPRTSSQGENVYAEG